MTTTYRTLFAVLTLIAVAFGGCAISSSPHDSVVQIPDQPDLHDYFPSEPHSGPMISSEQFDALSAAELHQALIYQPRQAGVLAPGSNRTTVFKKDTNQVYLQMAAPKKAICGEPVYIDLVVANKGTRNARYEWYSYLEEVGRVHFDVTRGGIKVPLTLRGKMLYTLNSPVYFKSGPTHMAPKDRFTRKVNLIRYFDFSLPGDYKISATWSYNSGTVQTPPLSIKVTNPPDVMK